MKRPAATSPVDHISFDKELDRRVAQRTAELTAANEQLKRELSERQRVKEVLREGELFSLIVESIPVPVAITSPTGEVEAVNKPTLEYFGRTFEELKGWKSSDIVHPDDLQRTVATQLEALQTGSAYNVESRHRRADGTYRWFNVLGLPLRDAQGNILRWFILQIDIDDRKRAEESLRSAERNLSLTINSIPTFISVSKADGTILSVNQAALDYHGITFNDVQKEDFRTRYFHPDDAQRLRAERKEALKRPLQFEYEVRALGKDGEYRWFLVRFNPLLDDQGRIERWYATAFDIEDRKRTEEALRSAERNLDQIINTIPALAWSARPDGTAEYFNQQYLDFVGLSAEQVKDWGWTTALHPDDSNELANAWQRIMASGEPGEAEGRMRRRDGEYRWFLFRASPIRDEKGSIVKWYGINTDIDDLKKAEAAQQSSERNLREITNVIPTFIHVLRPDGSVLYVNQPAMDYTGLTMADVLKEDYRTRVFHPEDLDRIREERRDSLTHPVLFENEQCVR